MEIIINPTNLIINIKTRLIKSCKKINSSIIGEFPSCNPNWPQVIIFIYGGSHIFDTTNQHYKTS
jgi:hypothetical protein